MDDLLKFQTQRIQVLEDRNLYLENELKQAKQILQDLINDWEVNDAEIVEPKPMDDKFQTPTEQLNNFFRDMYK
jgi:small-conductance mechanosensitive channel